MGKVLEFYKGERPNQEGLYLKDIMNFRHDDLEYNHSYIQWLFPLVEPSLVIPDSPVLENDDIEAFAPSWGSVEEMKEKIKLRKSLIDSFNKMISFYGLKLSLYYKNGEQVHSVKLIRDPRAFEDKAKNWLTPKNHNFLRITRILTSLMLLGNESTAKMLHECLCDIYEDYKGTIGPLTKQFWDEAMEIKNEQ